MTNFNALEEGICNDVVKQLFIIGIVAGVSGAVAENCHAKPESQRSRDRCEEKKDASKELHGRKVNLGADE